MLNDLTTLDRLKTWMDVSTTTRDVAFKMAISAVSQVIRGYCNRQTFLSQVFTETYIGQGSSSLVLRQFPVTSISSLAVGAVSVPAASGNQNNGYSTSFYDGFSSGNQSTLRAPGYTFYDGEQVTVTYAAGYLTSNEAQVVDQTSHQATPYGASGFMAADAGVSYANGAALVAVGSNPAAGQYVAPQPMANAPTSAYQFAPADAGASVLLNYSFIPTDLEFACIELAIERVAYSRRVAEKSHSSGGSETVSFLITDLPPWAKMSLSNFCPRVPV